MKLKVKANKKITDLMKMSKETAFYNDEQVYLAKKPIQFLLSTLQKKQIDIRNILKYNFKKVLNKRDKVLDDNIISNRYKSTKVVQQLLVIKYINELMRKIYYSTKAISKMIRYYNSWMTQQIQTQLYYLRKIQQITTCKEEIASAHLKYHCVKLFYKEIFMRYIGNICKKYYITLKKYKKLWAHDIVLKTAIRSKRRNRIIPLIFKMRKRLFKHIRSGFLFNIRYWMNNIKEITKKYNIFKDDESINLFVRNANNYEQLQKEHMNNNGQSIIYPLVLLTTVFNTNKRYRFNTINQAKKYYYSNLIKHIIIHDYSKKFKKKKRNKPIKKKRYYARMAVQHLMYKKKKYLIRKKYLSNRVNNVISINTLTKHIRAKMANIKFRSITKLFFKKYVSMLLVLLQNRHKFKIFKTLGQRIYNPHYYHHYKKKKKLSIWAEFKNKRKKRKNMRSTKRRKKKQTIFKMSKAARKAKYRARYPLSRDASGYWIIEGTKPNKFNKKYRKAYYKIRKMRERRFRWIRKKSKMHHLVPANITALTQMNFYNNLKTAFAI